MTQFLAAKSIILIGTFMALFFAETIYPKVRRRLGPDRYISNIGLWAFTVPLSALVVIPLTAFAATQAFWTQPVLLAPSINLLLNLILLDLFLYWSHRAFHEFDILWRFHAVHHLDQTLDTTSAVRFHFGEVFISALLRAAFVFVMAIPLTTVIIFEVLVLISAMFQHSNLRLPKNFEEGLRKLIVTPSHHWVHHHPGPDTQKHYGTISTVWDRLFGTWSQTKRDENMPIGIDDHQDVPIADLLIRPFKDQSKLMSADDMGGENDLS